MDFPRLPTGGATIPTLYLPSVTPEENKYHRPPTRSGWVTATLRHHHDYIFSLANGQLLMFFSSPRHRLQTLFSPDLDTLDKEHPASILYTHFLLPACLTFLCPVPMDRPVATAMIHTNPNTPVCLLSCCISAHASMSR